MKVSTLQVLAQDLADDGAPEAVLLLVAVVVDALELFETGGGHQRGESPISEGHRILWMDTRARPD
jgi:hypothetical protein